MCSWWGGGVLRANKEPTGYSEGQSRASTAKGSGFDIQTAHHGAEVRAFGYLYMVVGFCKFPLGGQKMVHATLGTEIGERTTHASGEAEPE